MRKKNFERQTQQWSACSPLNGTRHRTSTKIACVEVSALIAGKLFTERFVALAPPSDSISTK